MHTSAIARCILLVPPEPPSLHTAGGAVSGGPHSAMAPVGGAENGPGSLSADLAAITLSGQNRGRELKSGSYTDRLAPGDYMQSSNGRFVAYMQVGWDACRPWLVIRLPLSTASRHEPTRLCTASRFGSRSCFAVLGCAHCAPLPRSLPLCRLHAARRGEDAARQRLPGGLLGG